MAQGNPTFKLVMRRGPQPNQVFELSKEVSNLGRDITNDIVINDREVSRHHLRFMRGADGYTVEDLGSTNGTFINGKRVTGAQPLKNGDLVSLGETVTLGYEAVRAGEEPEVPPTVIPPQPTAQSPSGQSAPPASEDDRYRPPQQPDAPAAQSPNPYQPPQPAPQPPAAYQPEPYQPPAQQPNYEQPAAYAQQQDDQYAYAAGAYGSPPPPGQGYDYDPYAMREEEGGNMGRYLLFGCLGVLVFCCCVTVILAVVIDTFDLYCSVPVLGDVVEAVGLKVCP